jgi:hypothetical protein
MGRKIFTASKLGNKQGLGGGTYAKTGVGQSNKANTNCPIPGPASERGQTREPLGPRGVVRPAKDTDLN